MREISALRTLARDDARRLAVEASGLAGDARARSVLDVAHRLGDLQLDPTSTVARSHLLVLWSRLGVFDPAELDRLLWRDRELFEYAAFILPTRDVAIHAASMRAYPVGESARARLIRSWLEANHPFADYVLAELRARGPLRARDLEDRAAVPWRSGGWNDGKKATSRMLELLHRRGRILVAGRNGGERRWDLAERVLPALVETEPLTHDAAARQDISVAVGGAGIVHARRFRNSATSAWGDAGPAAADALEAEGVLERVRVDEVDGEWLVPVETSRPSRSEAKPPTLLSPFDNLIRDRVRAEALFDFRYRLEIYVPKAKREYGFWVMPVLAGDALVGRVDVEFDRAASTLRVNRAFPEPGRTLELEPALASLAAFVGAESIER